MSSLAGNSQVETFVWEIIIIQTFLLFKSLKNLLLPNILQLFSLKPVFKVKWITYALDLMTLGLIDVILYTNMTHALGISFGLLIKCERVDKFLL